MYLHSRINFFFNFKGSLSSLQVLSMVEKFETLNWLKNGTEKTLATRNMTFKIVNGMTLTKHFVHIEALVDISVTT